MNAVTPLTDEYLAEFEASSDSLPGHDLQWMRDIRRRGIETFGRIGFPTTRNEHWKYTNVRNLTRVHYALAAPSSEISGDILDLPHLEDAYVLVFVNGVLARELSSQESAQPGVSVESLSAVLEHEPAVLTDQLARHADVTASGFATNTR